ncbi:MULTISPECIES: DNA polymerase III subunit gamma/tau [Methylococcus]|uniref:DNA polymerase III subunit gamma/tau n=1 Tax=Methylococcus capsulatus TaxID=414 RepID=A0ABZ2FBF9_METCP|nr:MULTISPECIES: DNA polymerase III subunit gamma/tau [Methylococcus]MDF9391988.1 DNA polymerase III subunit gamma/tau [Methylococcus capsulatus]
MLYQALARKWRPHDFTEVVGQEHVVKALTHALEANRMHHAYLFTGTRGVGKTTLARILAKAINCEDRQGPNPCGRCLSCREVDDGRFIDLIEVDAASRTKVEDTRELLENVQYAPNQGRYKVYLIDEVHMLSGHSFNALLKTLEEPPPHVKFLLATTDPQKIPVTVLSRCLQFNLKRLTPEQIRAQMVQILAAENLEFEPGAAKALARAARGSMRDGLSLLDQAIAHCGGRLTDTGVSAMLGTVSREPVYSLLDALAEGRADTLLAEAAALAEFSPDYQDVVQQLLAILHQIAIAQFAPDAIRHDEEAECVLALARRLAPEDTQLYYQIALQGQKDLQLAPDPRDGFEMLLLRMLAFRPQAAEAAALRAVPPTAAAQRPPSDGGGIREPRSLPEGPHHAAVRHPVAETAEPAARPAAAGTGRDWPQMIEAMNLAGMTRQLASHCVLRALTEQTCELALDPRQAQIHTPTVTNNLETALQKFLGRPIKLTIRSESLDEETPAAADQRAQAERQREAELEIENDATVHALKDMFGAQIVAGSTRPLDSHENPR